MKKIPITKPYFDECERKAVLKPIESGWLVQGPFVLEFEKLFAEFTGSKFAIATSSCTAALHLALIALGIGEGDKVVVPSFTYIASANAIEYTGAEVVFCDIDLRTFNIDEAKIEELVKRDNSIRAIMPVNLFGLCSNLPSILNVARKYNLKVIEDSACGFDAWIGDRHSGTFGDCGCFSFHPRKAICTGEGGMVITNNKHIAEKIAQLRDHGATKSDFLRHEDKGGSLLPRFPIRGYNYRMTDIQGALGVCQMSKKNYIMAGRRKIAKHYDYVLRTTEVIAGRYGKRKQKLSNLLIPPYVPEGYKHGYQSYVCIFTAGENIKDLLLTTGFHTHSQLKEKIDRINIKRNIFMEELEERGVSTRQGTHAVHTLEYYKNKYNLKDEDYIMSYAADRLSVALPLYTEMNDREFDYVIQNIKGVLEEILQ